MRVAHLSDLHYAASTLAEVDRCVGYALERASEAQVDAVVISGDSTDHALDLHAPAVEALVRRVRQLTERCPVLLLQGTLSHEPPGTLNVFRLLGGKHPVYVADRIKQVALTEAGQWVESAGWRFDQVPDRARAVFSCLPSINRAQVAACVDAGQAAEALGRNIADLLAGWGVTNAAMRRARVPTIAVSHGTVSGCVTEHGVPMAGLDHEFTTGALFGAQACAFLLGHIHKHQSWREQGAVAAYAGSIGRLHYGEEDEKGFLLWEVGAESALFQFVATPARRMVHFDFEGLPDIEALKAAADQTSGAFVRVRWNVPEEDQGSVDRGAIEAALQGAAEVKLAGRIVPVVRSRAQGISQAQTLAEKVRKWAATTGVEAGGLLERLARIEAWEIDQILEEIKRDTDVRGASEVMSRVLGAAQAQSGSRAGPNLTTEVGPGAVEGAPMA